MAVACERAANATHHPPFCKGFQDILCRYRKFGLWFLGKHGSDFLPRGGATELLVKRCGSLSDELTVIMKLADCCSPRSLSLWIWQVMVKPVTEQSHPKKIFEMAPTLCGNVWNSATVIGSASMRLYSPIYL